MEVVGVIKDFKQPTHFNIEIISSFITLEKLWSEDVHTAWQWDGWFTYVKLRPDANPELLADKLDEFVKIEQKEYLESANHRMDFSFVPVKDIHLTSHLIGEFKPNGDEKTVKFLSIIGFLILIIAWINYINLSTARATDRGKEVGVRKTNGATKDQLMFQFLFDSLLINLNCSCYWPFYLSISQTFSQLHCSYTPRICLMVCSLVFSPFSYRFS